MTAPRFATSYLDGPETDRDAFIATDMGRTQEIFFTTWRGIGEADDFVQAEGFSVVSDSLVLAYRDALPDAIFTLDGDRVEGSGSGRSGPPADHRVMVRHVAALAHSPVTCGGGLGAGQSARFGRCCRWSSR